MGLPLLDGAATRATPVQVSPFADLVAQADAVVEERLGGELVIYQPAIGPEARVTGMFDAVYVLAQASAEAGVETVAPAVFLTRAAREQLPTDPEQDKPTLIIRGLAYRVIERQPDGIGGITLALRQVT